MGANRLARGDHSESEYNKLKEFIRRQDMKNDRVFLSIMKYLGIVLLIDLVLIGLVLLIGWWAMWQSLEEYKFGIQIAAILVIGLGFLGLEGNLSLRKIFKKRQNLSAPPVASQEGTRLGLFDLAKKYAFMLTTFTAGGICLVIGWLMY